MKQLILAIAFAFVLTGGAATVLTVRATTVAFALFAGTAPVLTVQHLSASACSLRRCG